MEYLLGVLTATLMSRLVNNNLFVFILSLIIAIYLFKFKYNKREIKISTIFGFFLSIVINSYVNLNIFNSTNIFRITTIMQIIGLVPIITYTLLYFYKHSLNLKTKSYKFDQKLFNC